MNKAWYQLSSKEEESCGSIKLEIWLIYSWKKYYLAQADKIQAQIDRLNKDIGNKRNFINCARSLLSLFSLVVLI